jgi:hypothetical protein
MTKARIKSAAGAIAYSLLESNILVQFHAKHLTWDKVRDSAAMERKYIEIVNVHINVNR